MTRKLCNKKPKKTNMVRNKTGKFPKSEEEVRKMRKEFFEKALNRRNPSIPADIFNNCKIIEEIDTDPTRQ